MHNKKVCELIETLDGYTRALKSYIRPDGTFDMDLTKLRMMCFDIRCVANQLEKYWEVSMEGKNNESN